MSLKENTQALFAEQFGYPASHVIQAPGRVGASRENSSRWLS
jgi:galactokinase